MHKMDTEFPGVGRWTLVSCQQLPGSTRKSRTGFDSKQALDSGMHRSESGSGLQAEQRAGSSPAGSHGRRERDPHDPRALKWLWHAWHGIPRWSISGHLPVRPSPQVRPLPNSHLRDPRDLSVTLAVIVIIINRGLFLHSLAVVSSV